MTVQLFTYFNMRRIDRIQKPLEVYCYKVCEWNCHPININYRACHLSLWYCTES